MLKRTLVLATVAIALLAICVCLPNGSDAVSTADEIQSAVNEATDGTETAITLENDITLTETLDIPAGKVIILDLAGNTLSIESGFTIEVSGELTINDSEEDGGISTGAGVAVITRNGSETTINGGTFVSEGTLNSYSRALEVQGDTTITAGSFTTTVASGAGTNFANAISVNGDEDGTYQPTLTIIPVDNSDVVVSSEHDYALSVRYGATLNIHGGTISGSDDYQDIYNLDFPDGGTISVKGGSFAFEVPSEYIADGYVCVPSDERFIVMPTTEAETVTVSTYDELVSALDGDPTVTDSITMDSDITIPAGVQLTLDFPDSLIVSDGVTLNILGTLEVNGYLYVDGTLTVSDMEFVENPLNVSIRDGTITGFPDGDEYTIMTPMDLQWLALANITSSMPSHIELGTDLDMSGYDYTSIGNYGTEVSGIEFDGNGHTIRNITQDTGTADAGLFGDLYASDVHDLTLTGFNLKATSGYVGFLAGCIGDSCTFTSITITDSTLYTSGSYGNAGFVGGVGGLQGHVVEFIDCHISDCAIDGYANTGGFWGTCSGAGSSFGVYNSSMENVDINIELTGASAEHPGSIGIVGGFCTSQSIEVIGLATTDVSLTIHTEPVTEPPFAYGTDNADTDNIDSTAVKDSNGDWVAMEDDEEIVATINGTPYTSINAAIENADAGDIITLVTSVTEDVVIPSGANISLDLGNHSITNVSGDTITIESGAIVVITGDGTVDNITHQKAAIHNLGTVTIEGGDFTRSQEDPVIEVGASTTNSWYLIVNEGTMTINDGNFRTGTGTSYGNISSLIRNGTGASGNAVMIITGGTFTTAANVIKNEPDGTITAVTGGTFTMDNTEQGPQGGNNIIQNYGTISQITGGTFKAVGDTVAPGYPEDYRYGIANTENGNIGEIGGNVVVSMEGTQRSTALIFQSKSGTETVITGGTYEITGTPQDAGYKNYVFRQDTDSPVTINGGDFTGYFDVRDAAKDAIDISNGSFTYDVSDYLAEDVVITGSDGSFTVVKGYTVTFVVDDVVGEVPVVSGATVPADSVPSLPTEPGYEFAWKVEGEPWDPSAVVESDIVVTAQRSLVLSVSISVADDSVTLNANPECLAAGVTYAYQWSKDGVPMEGETEPTVTVTTPGLYSVTVKATAADVSASVMEELSYRPTTTDPEEPVPEFDITHDGDSAHAETESEMAVITSDGEHDDVSLDVEFTSEGETVAGISINGTVSQGGITVSVKPIGEETLIGYAGDLTYENLVGVDVSLTKVPDFEMIIKVPFPKSDDGFVGAVDAYFVEDGKLVPVLSRIMGEEVWIYTDHNTPYMVVVTEYSETPVMEDNPTVVPEPEPDNPPIIWDDDDDYVPIPPTIVLQDDDDGNMTGVAACAAAAVAAAIIAAFLIMEYRKD